MSELTFFDLCLTGVVPPKATVPMPKKQGQVIQSNIASLLNWVITKQLTLYSFNRGDGRTAKATVDSILKSGIKPDVLGECTIGEWVYGENNEKVMCFNNWHSRMYAILKLYIDGKLTKHDLAIPVSVRVQSDFLDSYQRMNANGSAHRTSDKIKNPQLAYGVLRRIFDELGSDIEGRIGDNKWTVLSSVLYTIATPNCKWYWPEVYQKRGIAMKVASEQFGALVWTPTQLNKIVQSIRYWDDVTRNLASEGVGRRAIGSLIHSAGFFGYVVNDRLKQNSCTPKNPAMTARKVNNNLEDVLRISPELCRGSRPLVVAFTDRLDKIFKGRRRDKTQTQQPIVNIPDGLPANIHVELKKILQGLQVGGQHIVVN